MIPPEGRDVQCSACGQVWFQGPEPAPAPALAGDGQLAPEAAGTAASEIETRPEPEPVEPDQDLDQMPDPEPDPQVLRRHSLDETMMAVLREEAERESRARAEEAARAAGRGVEMQPDLGLPEAEPASQLRIRRREIQTAQAEDAGEAAAAELEAHRPQPAGRNPRRELLPDIEQINSTLDADPGSRDGAGSLPPLERPERRRSGFRSGFLLMLVLAGLAWAAYVQAPRLIQSAPQAEPALTSYVALVDKVRSGLDGLVQGLLGDGGS